MAKEIKDINQIAYKILIEPWITEEASRVAEMGKYIFKVDPRATKGQIGKAVEEVYGVKVEAVNTIKIPRKKRTRGAKIGWKSGYKKAVVTVKEGDKIDLFESK